MQNTADRSKKYGKPLMLNSSKINMIQKTVEPGNANNKETVGTIIQETQGMHPGNNGKQRNQDKETS